MNVIAIVHMCVVGSGQNINLSQVWNKDILSASRVVSKRHRSMHWACYEFSGMPYQRSISGHKPIAMMMERESLSCQIGVMLNLTTTSQLAMFATRLSEIAQEDAPELCGSCTYVYAYQVFDIESRAFVNSEYAKRYADDSFVWAHVLSRQSWSWSCSGLGDGLRAGPGRSSRRRQYDIDCRDEFCLAQTSILSASLPDGIASQSELVMRGARDIRNEELR